MPSLKDAPAGVEMPTLHDMNVAPLEEERYLSTWSYVNVTDMAQ